MNEPQKANTEIAPYQPLSNIALTVNLTALHESLNTYGKGLSSGAVLVWERALRMAEVTGPEFDTATDWWVQNRKDFPTPADFIAWIREQREDADTKAAIAALQIQIRQEADAKAAELAEKYRGWSMEDLKAHIGALRPGLVKSLPVRGPIPPVEFTPFELAEAEARAEGFRKATIGSKSPSEFDPDEVSA